MSEQFYDYKKELEILGITNQSQLTVKYIEKIKRRLLYKYHTDHYQNLSKEDDFYKNRTASIIDAANTLIAFLEKGHYTTAQEKGKIHETEEISVRKIQEMQKVLLGLWEKIKQTNYKFNYKVTVLSNGWYLKDMLRRDLEIYSSLSVSVFISISGAILMYTTAFLLLGLFAEIKYGFIAGQRVGSFFGILFFIHLILSIVALLPLSRLWIPERIQDILNIIINSGIYYYYFLVKIVKSFLEEEKDNYILFLALLCGLYFRFPIFLEKIFRYIIANPLYNIAISLAEDKIIGKIEKRTKCYAGYSESYIEELLNKKPKEFTRTNYFHLSRMYSELKDA